MLTLNLIPAALRKRSDRKPFLRTVLFVLVMLIAVVAGAIAVLLTRGGQAAPTQPQATPTGK